MVCRRSHVVTDRAPVFGSVALGPGSPLLTAGGTLRALTMRESEAQRAFVALCVGTVTKEPRRPGDGMTARYPELYLLYAIPNGGKRNPREAGIMKAEGVFAAIPDLCLPVPRVPFVGLYLEFKREGKYGTKQQREVARMLRDYGHCVVEVQTIQEAVDATVGYLTLPAPALDRAAIDRYQTMLTPKRR
jgi:hypothetical protein